MSTNFMGTVTTIWPLVLMGLLFYFMLYRPQKKQQKQRNDMLNALKEGSKVVTIGGLIGEITKIHDDKITLKIAENVEVQFIKSAVGHLRETAPKK